MLYLLLLAPVLLVYGNHYAGAFRRGVYPTGFVQYDQPYYVANARQYIDGRHSGLLYANPYDPAADSPCIYFQPQILTIGMLLAVAPNYPGPVFLLFGLGLAILGVFFADKLIAHVCPAPRWGHLFMLLLFFWGGGILSLMGLPAYLDSGHMVDLLRFDPGQGWWFFNLGRNFVFPTEAYYHAVVLGLLAAVAAGRYRWLLVLLPLIGISHPFTGTQYLIAFCTWLTIELVVVRSKIVPRCYLAVLGATLAGTLSYYLIFLPSHASHRALMAQWELAYNMPPLTAIGAYTVVALLALARCTLSPWRETALKSPFNRALLTLAAISFLLANHNWFIAPRQPLHFTRGHIWMPLFLLGAPVILAGVQAAWKRLSPTMAGVVLGAAVVLALLDNAVWFTFVGNGATGIVLPENVHQAMMHLPHNETEPRPLLIADNETIAYIAAVFAPVRPYVGHPYNTPNIDAKRAETATFFANGTIPAGLENNHFLVFVQPHQDRFKANPDYSLLYESPSLALYVHRPANTLTP